MATVYLSSNYNSTMFTTCCHCAICRDENHCPRCGEEVLPNGGTESETDRLRWNYAYGNLKKLINKK